jgi:hypothetical protein
MQQPESSGSPGRPPHFWIPPPIYHLPASMYPRECFGPPKSLQQCETDCQWRPFSGQRATGTGTLSSPHPDEGRLDDDSITLELSDEFRAFLAESARFRKESRVPVEALNPSVYIVVLYCCIVLCPYTHFNVSCTCPHQETLQRVNRPERALHRTEKVMVRELAEH